MAGVRLGAAEKGDYLKQGSGSAAACSSRGLELDWNSIAELFRVGVGRGAQLLPWWTPL